MERGVLTIDGVEYQGALDKFSGSTTLKATTAMKEQDFQERKDKIVPDGKYHT